jgi:hypothetical protein
MKTAQELCVLNHLKPASLYVLIYLDAAKKKAKVSASSAIRYLTLILITCAGYIKKKGLLPNYA